MRRLLRGLLLLATAGLIAKLMLTGQMALYMSPALDPLTVATGAVLAGMGAHEVWAAVRQRPRRGPGARPPDLHGRTFSAALLGGNESHHGSMTDEALNYLLVLVPIGLGLLTVPRALDPNALGGQDAGRVVIAYSTTPASSAAGPPEQPIRDVPDLFRYLRTAGESGVGQPVHLVGMVAHGDSLAADEFVLLRYSIVHCVADAQPLGLLVRTPDASTSSSSATWVEIDGTLATIEHGGAHLVSVIASRVSPTPEPPDPYLQTF